jgi:signal transduction histidine kinase
MLNRMRIREKLALALMVPLLTVVGLSGFVVVDSGRQADAALRRSHDIDEQVTLATSGLTETQLLSAIQTERNSEVLFLTGLDPSVLSAGLEEKSLIVEPSVARAKTDDALRRFRQTVAGSTPAVREIFEPVIAAYDRVQSIRQEIDTSTEPKALASPLANQAFVDYGELMTVLFDANSKVAGAVDDAHLRNGAALLDLSARQRAHTSEMISKLAQTRLPLVDVPSAVSVSTIRAQEAARDEQMRQTSADAYGDVIDHGLNDARLVRYREAISGLVEHGSGDVLALIGPTAVETWDAFEDLDAALGSQLRADADGLRATALHEADDAQQRQSLVTVIGFVALLVAAVNTLLAARSISRPLARLARGAEDMADRRLPGAVKEILETPLGEDVELPDLDGVPTGGGYEIHEVAEALNSVQSSAVGLAVEQAVLRRNISDSFINLGRRNQNLLGRLIDSVTQMEHDETDPKLLKRLFALDHLATRMRRNAESLLLLAGLDPHRQWSAPVPIVQVVRGALGEVENYQRVAIRAIDDAVVKGAAAADVTHLVAELLENAIRFSPPDREVEVIGRAVDGDYELAIIDAGLGMSGTELDEANRRLAGGESFTVAPSKYLGHYVVGVQAARLGMQVRLQPSPASGVTARITMGDALAEPAATPPPDAHRIAAAVIAEPEPQPELVPEPAVCEPVRHELVAEPEAHRFVSSTLAVTPVADVPPTVQADMAVSEPAEAARTRSGYVKRQRGANVPRTSVTVARGEGIVPTDGANQPIAKADSVRDLLSGLQSGADRARAESSGATSNQEDLRERS